MLYRLLTGQLPFQADEPMEWIHCHIARRPVPPAERRPGVPAALSAVVMKCLTKTAEERYQTAAGLVADLERCLAAWRATGTIETFELGAQDIPDRLRIPAKLYGREREVAELLAAFERVAGGGPLEFVLVSGYAGVGKSAVVHELHKALAQLGGHFAAGKFDQYKRDIPYSTLAQAFQDLIRGFLGKDENELNSWREAFRAALDSNGALMVALVPELKLVIGDQPPVPDLPPQEAEHRFQKTFCRFTSVFARAGHPLVLFLDDLQWLDAATLDLLAYLAAHAELQHVLLVGAYRDNEVDAGHPLMRCLDNVRQAGGRVHEIVLAPLTPSHLERLVADALRCPQQEVAPLARMIYDKTGGNPLFVIQSLTALAEDKLLAFDAGRRGWRVGDLNHIHARAFTDNVAELMARKLTRLPEAARQALALFACLGNAASVDILGLVLQLAPKAVHASLCEAVRAGLAVRRDDGYAFLHDRAQEAAYSLIPAEARAETHLRIGRSLISGLDPGALADRIFEVVSQLNRGSERVDSRQERERIAELNLLAGRRAKGATAYASALAYFAAGAALLPDDCWERRYDLQFALQLSRAECEFLTGARDEAEARFAELAHRAASLPDLATVTRLRVELFLTVGQSVRATEICLDYLRRVGVEWSAQPTDEEVRQEYDGMWSRLGGRPIEALLDLPRMSDPVARGTLDVLATAMPAALFTDSNLRYLVIGRIANLSLEHGNSDASCNAYAWLGAIVGAHFGDYEAGFRFGQLGIDLVDQRGLDRFKARVYQDFGSHVIHWSRPLQSARVWLRRAFEAAQQAGDLTYASYSCANLVTHLFVSGDPLAEVQREAESMLDFVRHAQFGLIIDVIAPQVQLVRTLRGLTPVFGTFDADGFDEGRFEQHLEEDPHLVIPACWYWIRKLPSRPRPRPANLSGRRNSSSRRSNTSFLPRWPTREPVPVRSPTSSVSIGRHWPRTTAVSSAGPPAVRKISPIAPPWSVRRSRASMGAPWMPSFFTSGPFAPPVTTTSSTRRRWPMNWRGGSTSPAASKPPAWRILGTRAVVMRNGALTAW
jgi:predicted ATPase